MRYFDLSPQSFPLHLFHSGCVNTKKLNLAFVVLELRLLLVFVRSSPSSTLTSYAVLVDAAAAAAAAATFSVWLAFLGLLDFLFISTPLLCSLILVKKCQQF